MARVMYLFITTVELASAGLKAAKTSALGHMANSQTVHCNALAVKPSAFQSRGATRSCILDFAGWLPIKRQQTLAADGMLLARSMVEQLVCIVAIYVKLALQLTVEVHDHSRCHMFLNVSDLLVVAFHL